MFRRKPKPIGELIKDYLRRESLETPLLQKRLIDSWPAVMGQGVGDSTGEMFIKNQTLFVKIQSAALRADLTMMRRDIVSRLNARTGSDVITDIKFF